MIPKLRTQTALSLIAVAALSACRPEPSGPGIAPSGLVAARTYRCDTVIYEKPMRMFTEEGEILDAAVIDAYRGRHALFGEGSAFVYQHPDNIFSTQSETVYYNGLVPYRAALNGEVLVMRQQDTGMYGQGNPQGSIEFLFNAEKRFLSIRDQILEVGESFTKLERVDEQNYKVRECFHLQGAFRSNVIRLPYTFLATRYKMSSYPFALRSGAAPTVPAGDTLLVREGYSEFK